MTYAKVTCQQCSEYEKCSLKTRMYVNYCGHSKRDMERHIKNAVQECRSRGGFLFRSQMFPSFKLNSSATLNLSPAT